MFIQTEETPNDSTLKFLLNQEVDLGVAEFTSKDEAQTSKLASMLFDIQHVERIFFGNNFISVSKSTDVDWEILKPHILTCITEYFILNNEDTEHYQEEEEVEHDEKDAAIVEQIQALMHSHIKPSVMQDGGDIQFKKYKDGIVFLKLKGACSGCPSASITLKEGIEGLLQYYIEEVKAVEDVDE